jgi:hypothetical protein
MARIMGARAGRCSFGFAALTLVGLFAGLLGCADLIGLEKRTPLPGVVDEGTGLTTTEECVDYCDTVMAACAADHAVYTTRDTCIRVCGALDPGDPSEPAGNTLACRHRQATNALTQEAPDEFCPAAGPAGAGVCGDDCEVYCQLLEDTCEAEYLAVADCEGSCAALADGGAFNVDEFYDGDNLDCRLIHLSASFAVPATHCGHARYESTLHCTPKAPGSDEPDCQSFCRNVAGACPGDLAMYESEAQCLATCAEWPVGDADDRGTLTVGCREYHSGAALAEPDTHCHHLGPGGDGVCAEVAAEGNCEGYCFLLEAACADAFLVAGGTQELCKAACLVDFAEDGAGPGSGYNLNLAAEGGLACRMLMLSRSLDGNEAACGHVLAADPCPEP